ncbi:MAG: hypothetical protein GXP54_00750 [Deltaproteobacteria bacterium]|nr:hypothetical protein [Deltaproteobacteria bacterium]
MNAHRRAMVLYLVCAMFIASPASAIGGPGGRVTEVVPYKGRMVDEAGKPVSGIFPITFKLYRGVKAHKAMWSESLWVAVDRGVYTVQLGEKKKLPAGKDLSKYVLGVEIKGLGEVAREPFMVKGQPTPAPRLARPPAASSGGGTKYADTAGYAVEADHAKNADRIQNLTIDDITRKVIEESVGASRTRIGKARRYGERVGGPGGTSEYNENCPRGYVMTGIRGGAGIYLDSIQIVCSPIE